MMRAPLRRVERIIDIEGPRGGRIYVISFACGHAEWRRSPLLKPSPMRRCMGCYVDAKLAEELKAERPRRDGDHCDDYNPGPRNARTICEGDGHYQCKECEHHADAAELERAAE